MTERVSFRRITHPRNSGVLIFPNRILYRGRSSGSPYSPKQSDYLYRSMRFSTRRINVFRRSFLARRDEDRYKSTGRRFPGVLNPSDPAALITFHEISSNSSWSPFLSLPPHGTPRRRDRVTDVHPSRGDPDGYAGFDGNKRMLV